MRRDLDLTNGDEREIVVLSARHTGAGVTLYNPHGGALDNEQVQELTAWLDDGASSVDRAEVSRLRDELAHVRGDVAHLVQALKDAWWLDAAGAYARLAEWAGR